MKETQFSAEKRVLMAMRKTLAKVVRDLTPSDSATRYPLSDDTVNDVKMCFDLIAAREKELAKEEGIDIQDKPRFIDEANAPKVISMSGLMTSSSEEKMSDAKEFSQEQMLALTRAVVEHMDEWKITPEDMLLILGVENQLKARQLNACRNGSKALPQQAETMQRIDHIVGISDALRTTFPFSPQMRIMWLQKPHRRFQKRPPLNVMLSEGVDGLQKVRIEVDCTYGYAISDAMHAAQYGNT